MTRLSLCTIAKDEQQMLPGLLSSVYGHADELVIGVDTRSTDRTAKIARQYGAHIVDVEWCDDFSYARNLTIDAATGDWILVLDADERLLPAGAAVIRAVLDCAPEVPAADAVTGCAFLMEQRDLDGTLGCINQSSGRLFRRRSEIRYRGIVHEEPTWLPDPTRTCWAMITGAPAIVHYGYDEALWDGRGKYERNRRLLEQRVAANPDDTYAQERLRATMALGR